MTTLNEADVEQAALSWLKTTGWTVVHGPDIAPDAPDAERTSYDQVVLEQRPGARHLQIKSSISLRICI